ncbi:hypothetical protein RQP46_011496 [Phenoliferia psychrophenolica]
MSDDIKISAIDSASQEPICGVCKTQFSRYTCPRCNLRYCCLTCFRSEVHATCSESFDRSSLVDEIRSAKDKTADEKRAMMDMLAKFEEQSAEQENADGEEEDEEELDEERRELERKLDGLDLDSLSPEDVLALLSPAQRATFQQTLQDPTKVSALVSAEFQDEPPWWIKAEKPSVEDEESGDEDGERLPPLLSEQQLPPLKLGPDGKVVGNQLVYNIVAVLFAYAYTLRTFSLESFSSLHADSTERTTAINMLSQLVPFLVEKSTVVLQDAGSAIEFVVAREKLDTLSPKLLILLLGDLTALLQPTPISLLTTPLPTLASHPCATTLHALSDLHNLFTPKSNATPVPASAPLIKRPQTTPQRPTKALVLAAQKLVFYAAIVAAPGSSEALGIISNTLEQEKREREVESVVSEGGIRERRDKMAAAQGQVADVSEGRAKIVEIG